MSKIGKRFCDKKMMKIRHIILYIIFYIKTKKNGKDDEE